MFEDESTVGGVLAITQLESEPVLLVESGEGPYFQCSETTCPEEPDGLGVMGTFIDEEAAETFTSLFIDPDLDTYRLVAFDADGLLGTEIEGEDTFLGGGQWTNDDGSTVNVAVGISRIPEEGTSEGVQRELASVLKARQDTLGDVDVSKVKELR